MSNSRINPRRLPILLITLTLVGCGSATPQFAAVHGKVTAQGQPLTGGMIVFTPDAGKGGFGPLAHAEIQPDGSFILKSGDTPGAAVGWHRITLVAVHDNMPSGSGGKLTPPTMLLPDRYCCPDASGLSREIKSGVENAIAIDLE